LVATPIRPDLPSTWTVRRGDHLWSIAERTLAIRRGTPPTDVAVRRYWVELISTNRDRLADPDNPDLIFAGQVLLLPAA
jgi:nucleoid-associated protein YgaU